MQHNRVHNGSIEKTSSSGESLGVLAMGAINEIMSKNCVPHDFEDFLLQMFRNTFQLLQRLVRDQPNSTSCLQLLDSRLVIIQYWHTHLKPEYGHGYRGDSKLCIYFNNQIMFCVYFQLHRQVHRVPAVVCQCPLKAIWKQLPISCNWIFGPAVPVHFPTAQCRGIFQLSGRVGDLPWPSFSQDSCVTGPSHTIQVLMLLFICWVLI